MTLAAFTSPTRRHRPYKAHKSARRINRQWLVEAMPPCRWMSVQKICDLVKRKREDVQPHLFYAKRRGRLEQRTIICDCCAKRVVQWKRP